MIEVIFHLVILGKTPEIALLHLDEIFYVGHANVYHDFFGGGKIIIVACGSGGFYFMASAVLQWAAFLTMFNLLYDTMMFLLTISFSHIQNNVLEYIRKWRRRKTDGVWMRMWSL